MPRQRKRESHPKVGGMVGNIYTLHLHHTKMRFGTQELCKKSLERRYRKATPMASFSFFLERLVGGYQSKLRVPMGGK